MKAFNFSYFGPIALFALRALAAASVDEDAAEDGLPDSKGLAIQLKTTFPASEIFGTKIVNGQLTRALVAITNHESEPVSIEMIGGALWSNDVSVYGPNRIVRNLTTMRFGVKVLAGENLDLTYTFSTELHPQDLRLAMVAVLKDERGNMYTASAFNETVSVVEPDTSLFDPQIIFLYLMLAAVFGGTLYFIYSTWITTFFPQAKRRTLDGKRSKSAKKVETVDGAAGREASPSGAKTTAYDESWLPEGHIKRPEQKRSKSGTPRKTPAK